MTDKKQAAQFILLIFLTAMMVYLCWLMLQPFVPVILWSSILVIIFYPLYKKLRKKLGHLLSAIITIIISFLIVIIPVMIVTAAAINELSGVLGNAIGKIGEEINSPNGGQLMNFYNTVNSYINIEQVVKPEDIKNYLAEVSHTVLQATMGLLGGVVGTAISILLAVFTMYYLFRDGEKIIEKLPEILPIQNDQAKELIKETSTLINATLKGSLLIAFLQGLLTGVILWLLNVPSPVLLGVLAFLGALIPILGTPVVTVPVIVWLIMSGNYVGAVILAIFAALVIGLIDNFLYPKLVNKQAKMNELYVFFSVLGGLQLFGVLGLFIGPIILAAAFGLLTVFKGGKISTEEINLQ